MLPSSGTRQRSPPRANQAASAPKRSVETSIGSATSVRAASPASEIARRPSSPTVRMAQRVSSSATRGERFPSDTSGGPGAPVGRTCTVPSGSRTTRWLPVDVSTNCIVFSGCSGSALKDWWVASAGMATTSWVSQSQRLPSISS